MRAGSAWNGKKRGTPAWPNPKPPCPRFRRRCGRWYRVASPEYVAEGAPPPAVAAGMGMLTSSAAARQPAHFPRPAPPARQGGAGPVMRTFRRAAGAHFFDGRKNVVYSQHDGRNVAFRQRADAGKGPVQQHHDQQSARRDGWRPARKYTMWMWFRLRNVLLLVAVLVAAAVA